jgi:hypothetical protein
MTMSTAVGKSILQSLGELKVRHWFTKEFPNLVEKMISAMQNRNQIVEGGVVTAGGTISASVLQIDMTAVKSVLKGRIMADFALLNDVDLFTTAASIAQPIFTDGATAAAISLATDETAYVTVILCNTDGAGGAAEGDGGTPLLLAVVHGTALTYGAQTGHATSTQIQAALDASVGVHAGVTGWAHVAQILWDENSASPIVTIRKNRNNVIAAA